MTISPYVFSLVCPNNVLVGLNEYLAHRTACKLLQTMAVERYFADYLDSVLKVK
jgi:hypothetical protein